MKDLPGITISNKKVKKCHDLCLSEGRCSAGILSRNDVSVASFFAICTLSVLNIFSVELID